MYVTADEGNNRGEGCRYLRARTTSSKNGDREEIWENRGESDDESEETTESSPATTPPTTIISTIPALRPRIPLNTHGPKVNKIAINPTETSMDPTTPILQPQRESSIFVFGKKAYKNIADGRPNAVFFVILSQEGRISGGF